MAAPVTAAELGPAAQTGNDRPGPQDRVWEVPAPDIAQPATDRARATRAIAARQRAEATAASVSGDAPGGTDVTGDGWADLVVRESSADAGQFRWYAGDDSADPWTSPPVPLPAEWSFADLLMVGDVAGDPQPDVLVRDPALDNGTLWIYPRAADGGWGERIRAGYGWNDVDQVTLADVNADGRPDVVGRVPGYHNGQLNVYPHNGSTSGNPYTSAMPAGTGWNLARDIHPADIDGDGAMDILIRNGSGQLMFYVGNGSVDSNPWTTPGRRISTDTWNWATALMVGDVTGDGRPDVVGRDDDGALWIHPHDGSADPYDQRRIAAGTGWNTITGLGIADVDADGTADLVGQVPLGSQVWVYPNDHADTGSPWTNRYSVGTDWIGGTRLALVEVNGDGRPDTVTLDNRLDNGTLWIRLYDADRESQWSRRYRAGNGWNTMTKLAFGDVTGDGLGDVLGRDHAGALWIYPGTGDPAHPWAARTWAGSGWNTATELKLADLDGDSIADLVDLQADGSLWVYPTAGEATPYQVPGNWAGVSTLLTADVSATGHLDLVVRDSAGRLWIHPSTGSTTGNPWTLPRRAAGTGWDFALDITA